MHSNVSSKISVEKFAAYLDGKLSSEETKMVADLISDSSDLQDILLDSNFIDHQMSKMNELAFAIPDDIISFDFDLPQVEPINTGVGTEQITGHDTSSSEISEGNTGIDEGTNIVNSQDGYIIESTNDIDQFGATTNNDNTIIDINH